MARNFKNKASWDGKDNAYDYLRDSFENGYYRPSEDRVSSDISNRRFDNDFQRYLMTGEKASGRGAAYDALTKKDKKKNKSVEDRLFDAGIPPSQWQYYADKAGITNMNSKNDAKAVINYYNNEERYQGKDDDKDKEEDKDEKPTGQDIFAPYDQEYKLSQHWKDVHEDLSIRPPKLYEAQEDQVPDKDDQDEAAKLFTRKYAADVAQGLGIKEERRLNLENAMYSAPAFGKFHNPS